MTHEPKKPTTTKPMSTESEILLKIMYAKQEGYVIKYNNYLKSFGQVKK